MRRMTSGSTSSSVTLIRNMPKELMPEKLTRLRSTVHRNRPAYPLRTHPCTVLTIRGPTPAHAGASFAPHTRNKQDRVPHRKAASRARQATVSPNPRAKPKSQTQESSPTKEPRPRVCVRTRARLRKMTTEKTAEAARRIFASKARALTGPGTPLCPTILRNCNNSRWARVAVPIMLLIDWFIGIFREKRDIQRSPGEPLSLNFREMSFPY